MFKNLFLAVLIGIAPATAKICVNEFQPTEQLPARRNYIASRQDGPKPVEVYFHVASTVANQNRVTDEIVQTQFTVLHDAFVKSGFELSLVNTSRIVDDVIGKGFYEGISIPDWDGYVEYMTSTRRGGYDSLNVHFFTDFPSGISGQCNFPTVTSPGEQAYNLDACLIHADTMPGLSDWGTEPNKGHTAIHEVGHWFGLFHTFHGRSCESINDQVADTPAQSGASTGCPAGRDSCPGLDGLDPIHNYMDYSDDSCTTEFTPGQQARMHQQFDVYRKWEG